MNIDKNYFMSRLQAGESIDNIGNEIAAMMNQAVAEHNAQIAAAEAAKQAAMAAEAEKEAAKRELVEELAEIIQEIAILEGMDADELALKDEDIDQLVEAITNMFATMRDIKKLIASIEAKNGDVVIAHAPQAKIATGRIEPSDDQILADFIKMFN